jgi:hypothetical protein
MGKDIKEQSTEELKRKVKTGKVILIVCWSAIIISIVITLFYGKSSSITACSAGFAGLGIVTIAMLIGGKKIKEEIARRNDMPTKSSKEGIRPAAIVLPFLHGVLGSVALFSAGSRSGSGTYAFIVIGVWLLFGGGWFSKKFPASWPFIGILMNLPLWLFFIWAEAGQLKSNFWGIAACLGVAYLGVLLGRWWSTLQPRTYRRVFTLSLFVALVLLIVLFFLVQLPTPIPGDKQVFVGHWKSASGFELQIESDGTARILNNHSGSRTIQIEVGPNTVEELRVQLVGDTILDVVRPSYYGKTYKIDRYPYRDSSAYVMILNGITFLRE